MMDACMLTQYISEQTDTVACGPCPIHKVDNILLTVAAVHKCTYTYVFWW